VRADRQAGGPSSRRASIVVAEALASLIARIPETRMETQCFVGSAAPVTLAFLIEDYILHMQHHVDHMLKRERVTAYPSAATQPK
jgi:hypothetical protein